MKEKKEPQALSVENHQRQGRSAKRAAVAQFNETVQKKQRGKKKAVRALNKENVELIEVESSEDEIISSVKKRSRNTISSDEETKISGKPERKRKRRKLKLESEEEKCSSNEEDDNEVPEARRRIKRVVDSSDEDTENIPTPAKERKKKLENLVNRINKKKGDRFDFFEEASSRDEQSFDEDNLPMFEHEEFPPSDTDVKKKTKNKIEDSSSEEYDEDFIDDDEINENVEEEEEIESEEGNESGSDSRDDHEKDSDGSSDEEDYSDPFLSRQPARFNIQEELKKINQCLSRNTKEDKQNKKKYKTEMGKYQFQVRKPERNRAAMVDEKERYKRNLKVAKFDAGLKESRNLNKDDEEYFESQEANLYGVQALIFPHTMKRSNYNGRCEATGCGKEFIKSESKIVGATFLDHFNCKFMKKETRFGKEAYYWICREHMTSDDKSSDSESDQE